MSKLLKIKKIPEYIRQKFYTVCDRVQKWRRERYMLKVRPYLTNKDFSLIANNCNGGVISHDLGIEFRSQFVNLSMNASDYIQYLENFDKYNKLCLEFENSESYPIGIIDNIRIDFIHYKSNEEAFEKWEVRKKRINKDNMFFIFTEQGDCTYEHIKRFDNLDFPNKVVFTCKKYDDIKSAFYVKSFKTTKWASICF